MCAIGTAAPDLPAAEERKERRPARYATPRYAKPRTTVSPAAWPSVAAEAEANGLRTTARRLGVSHETVRTIVRRVRSATRAEIAASM